MEQDDDPIVEDVTLPLTRPPMYFGVDISVFVVNGLFVTSLFVWTGQFRWFLLALPIHFIFMFLCQRDPHIVRIVLRSAQSKKALRNRSFWGAKSYSP